MAKVPKLPIQSILNPDSPKTPTSPLSQPSGSDISSPHSDLLDAFPVNLPPTPDGQLVPKTKKQRDSSDFTYTRPQGPIKYPPFESLDDVAYNQMRRFEIYPFGEIGQYCAHVPYSSDKKDVYEKTGRESFHVFVYRFRDLENRTHDVMWDFAGGFVRISPFLKALGFKKTVSAKILDHNPGLRDITPQFTGGNRIAQGYWIPWPCAKAICATFCWPIAGALIPIFGPTFPDECVHPESPMYKRMQINEDIIRQAKIEVTAAKHANLNICQNHRHGGGVTSHPRSEYNPFNNVAMNPFARYEPPYPTAPHAWQPVESIPNGPQANQRQILSWSASVDREEPVELSHPTSHSYPPPPSSILRGNDIDRNIHPFFLEKPPPSLPLPPPPPPPAPTQAPDVPTFKRKRLVSSVDNPQGYAYETRGNDGAEQLPEPKKRATSPITQETEVKGPAPASKSRKKSQSQSQSQSQSHRRNKSSMFKYNNEEMRVAFSLVALKKGMEINKPQEEEEEEEEKEPVRKLRTQRAKSF